MLRAEGFRALGFSDFGVYGFRALGAKAFSVVGL